MAKMVRGAAKLLIILSDDNRAALALFGASAAGNTVALIPLFALMADSLVRTAVTADNTATALAGIVVVGPDNLAHTAATADNTVVLDPFGASAAGKRMLVAAGPDNLVRMAVPADNTAVAPVEERMAAAVS